MMAIRFATARGVERNYKTSNSLISRTPAIRGRRTLCGVPWMALLEFLIKRKDNHENCANEKYRVPPNPVLLRRNSGYSWESFWEKLPVAVVDVLL